jgi:hypothetical protein
MALPTDFSTLVLDRPDDEPESPSTGAIETSVTTPPPLHGPVVVLHGPAVIDLRRSRPGISPDLLRIGLAGLAVAFSYEGYRWLGVVTPGDRRLSALVFGRPGTALIAVLAVVASLAVAHSVGPKRSLTEGTLLASGLSVLAATCAEAAGVGPAAVAALGVTDLVFAATAFGFFLVTECRERRPAAYKR